MVDNDRAIADACHDAVISQYDGTHVVIVADTGKDNIGICRSGRRRVGAGPPMLLNPGIGFCGGPIENRDLVP
jgi:hypothetical protein